MPDVGFLHTASVHVDTFEALSSERHLSCLHQVEESWLLEANQSGAAAELRANVIAALKALRQTSIQLLTEAFQNSTHEPDFELADCSSAWPLFAAGDLQRFGDEIARQVLAQHSPNISSVVLAQASMAAALPFLESIEPAVLTSPASAMDHAVALLS